MKSKKSAKAIIGSALKFVIPLIISVGLCYLLFSGIDFREMADIVRHECRFGWIAGALAVSVFSHIFRAMRWRIQLNALGIKPPLFALVLSIFGTYAVNLVFPRLGEVWRTGYIAHRQDAPFATVFGSMVADRLSDTVTVLLLSILAFAVASGAITRYVSQNAATVGWIADLIESPWLWVGIAAVVAAVWWLVRNRSTNSVFTKIRSLLQQLWQGFAVIVKMPGKGLWLLLTFCIWGCYFLQMYIAFFAFPFTREVLADYGIAAVLVTFVLSSISMGVPSNGGIGPWQWAVIFGLGIYGVGATEAGAFANLVLGTSTLLLIVLGIFTFVCIALGKSNKNKHKPLTECRKS